MSKFTAEDLVVFYQKVADGGCLQANSGVWHRGWEDQIWGPNLNSDTYQWRIKPVNEHVDF